MRNLKLGWDSPGIPCPFWDNTTFRCAYHAKLQQERLKVADAMADLYDRRLRDERKKMEEELAKRENEIIQASQIQLNQHHKDHEQEEHMKNVEDEVNLSISERAKVRNQ